MLNITDDLDTLLEVLPPHVADAVRERPNNFALLEIVLDLGRPPEARPQEPPQLAPRRVEMRDPRVRQPFVQRLYLVPSYDPSNPREAAALSILSDVLGDGITSRLAQALQLDQKVAIDTGSHYSPARRDRASFSIYGVPTPDQDLATVEAAMDAVLAELVADGPTGEELARVKRLNRAARIFAQDSMSSQARRYGGALAAGQTVADVQNWPAVMEAVTAEEVRRVAEKYLVPETSVTGWLMVAKEAG